MLLSRIARTLTSDAKVGFSGALISIQGVWFSLMRQVRIPRCLDALAVPFGVDEAIESIGAELCYLPPDSPDFSPIEPFYARLKALLRAAAQRTILQLEATIGDLLDRFTASECRNYFRLCGYTLR